MRVQHNRPELHFVSRLVDGLIGLNEHRVTLVNVLERRGVEKFQTAGTSSGQIVIARTDVADLTRGKRQKQLQTCIGGIRKMKNPYFEPDYSS